MDLLPKNTSEFSSPTYWEDFFAKRHKSFEWYGDFNTLRPLICRLVKEKDQVLNIGCGNSTLGYDLLQAGYPNILNIDISDLVIKQMQTKYKEHLNEKFRFVKMDVFNLECDESSIDVVLDKGTLDALAVDSSEETVEKLHNMFDQIEKVLSTMGRYLLVSLLQEHILITLLNWIIKKSKCNFLTRIYKLKTEADESNSNKSFPTYLIVATKLKPKTGQDKCLFELCLHEDYEAKPLRTLKEDVVIDLIKEIHNYNLIQNHIKNNSLPLEEELCFELFDSSNVDEYKYKFIITEQFSRENKLKFAIFIVPMNREKEYLFATKEGRKEVCSLSSVQRLVFVILNANYQSYPLDQEQMHQELSPKVMDFAPKAYYVKPNQKIPILTVKDQERECVYSGSSKYSGEYGVYDVKTDENGKEVILRQLIFSSNKNLIQSEAKLKVTRKKKKLIKTLDHSYLACLHHGAIITGICLYNRLSFYGEKSLEQGLDRSLQLNLSVLRILCIGLGGGCLTTFAQNNLKEIPNVRIEFDVVEIDEAMVDVSKKWFDLNEELKADRFKITIIVEDGLVYLNKFKPDGHYDIIIFDIDNKSESTGLSCPPLEFLEQNALDNVKRLLKSDRLSLFMLNLAARNKTIKTRMESRLRGCFNQVNKYRIPDETNNIFYCFNQAVQLNELIDKERNLSDRMQKFFEWFNFSLERNEKFEISPLVDVCDFVTHLC